MLAQGNQLWVAGGLASLAWLRGLDPDLIRVFLKFSLILLFFVETDRKECLGMWYGMLHCA